MKLRFLILPVLLTSCFSGFSQDIYHDCGMEGNAKQNNAKVLNKKKNRYDIPKDSDYDTKVTLKALLEPGDDEARWSNTKAAEITGYVISVSKGGIETCNCRATDPFYMDTHIELLLDPKHQNKTSRVIVEVTPRIRKMMQNKQIDWTTEGLKKTILKKWIKVQGWLLFDEEHKPEAKNTNPTNAKDWRATAWEIHPLTSIEILSSPK
jgi:hypothetical protein